MRTEFNSLATLGQMSQIHAGKIVTLTLHLKKISTASRTARAD
jgi:hypothetical protein